MVRNVDHDQGVHAMREDQLFANLHALLPDLPSEADKPTIVDAAVKEIKNLEQIVETLEKKKQENLKSISSFPSEPSFVANSTLNSYESREIFKVDQGSSTSNPSNALTFKTWFSQNVVLNIYRVEAQFCICATKKSGLLTLIAYVLEKHMIDVVSANIMCNENKNLYMIHVRARQGSYDTNSLEETYKQVAEEIMTWIS